MPSPPYFPNAVPRAARDAAATALSNLAMQDRLALSFHAYMLIRAYTAAPSTNTALARVWTLTLLSLTSGAILLGRGEILPRGKLRSAVYRVGLFAPMVLSYFELRFLLPALQPRLLDEQLFAIDRHIFAGTTPALWLARFNQRPIVEWIGFFYYSYFWLMAAMLLPALFLDNGRRLHELMVGALVVCGGGHFIYTLVPGAGPYAYLSFAEPVNGGFFWRQIQATVAQAGAMLDIFPSLHTAYPVFFSLHAFGHRKTMPFKLLWPVVAFFAANMMVATVFLRWHWGVDVFAGLALAFTARRVGVLVARREATRDDDPERQPVWEPLFGESSST